jgi:hypothetical protein
LRALRPVLLLLALVGLGLIVAALRIDRDWVDVHVLPARCAVFPAEVAAAGRFRALLGGLGVLLLLLLLPVQRLAQRMAARGVSSGVVVRVALAVVLALVVSDLVLRRRARADAGPPASMTLPPVRPDPHVGWALDGPSTTVVDADGRAVTYAVDAAGDRAASEKDVADPAAPTLLFAGESLTFGLGVAWEQTYPALVGQRLGVAVVDAGVHGYGDDQIYLSTLDHLSRLQRPLAVVTVALADLLERDVSGSRAHLVVGHDGVLVLAPPQAEVLRTSPLVAFVERVAPWEDDASLRVARAVFTATDHAARARGARSLFVLTNFLEPCLPDASGRPAIEGRLFDGLPVEHIRVDLDPSWIVKSALHPDARAHAKLADAVAAALTRQDAP